MIPFAYLLDWRDKAPWPELIQVEQDLILSRILVAIYSNPFLNAELVFRGGTALHKLFISPPGRYSEDIDLVQRHAGPVGAIFTELRKVIDPILGKPGWKLGQGRATLFYSFFSEENPDRKARIKIEINTREHYTFLGHHNIKHNVSSPWYSHGADISTYKLVR